MMNLNNTPSAGPLTEADMARYRNLHRAYIPMGCGQSVLAPQPVRGNGRIRGALLCVALFGTIGAVLALQLSGGL